jgi:hypothetical protein
MTEMLLDWLNKEVKLSRSVSDIVEDMSNGYLIGEILHKHKQISNFNEYKDRLDPDTKIHNFRLIEKALRDLEIKVVWKSMKEILDKRKGVAARFLYQIKMALSKKGINFERLMLTSNNQLHSAYLGVKYPNQNEKYLIDAENKNSKPQDTSSGKNPVLTHHAKLAGINMNKEETMKNKYEKVRHLSEINAIEEKFKEEEYFKDEHDKKLDMIHQYENKFHTEKSSQDKKNLESWQKNISNMKEWEKNKILEEQKEANYFRSIVLDSFNKSAKETEMQIDVFDKNLSRLGLDIASIDPKLKKHSNAMMSSEMVMQKIKEKMEKQEAAKKEKDRRIRLIHVEQAKTQKELEIKKKEDLIKSQNSMVTINDPFATAHMKRLEYENCRALHDRQAKAQERLKKIENSSISSEFQQFSTPSKAQFNRESFLFDLQHENLKFRQKEIERKKVKIEKDYKLCSTVIDAILDITEEAFNYQLNKKEDLIDIKEWRGWMENFIYDNNIVKGDSYFEIDKKNEDEKTFSTKEKENTIQANKLLPSNNKLELETSNMFNSTVDSEDNEFLDYLNFKGQWTNKLIPEEAVNTIMKFNEVIGSANNTSSGLGKNIKNVSESAQEYELKDEEIENLTIPQENVKNYIFGEILEIITDLKFSYTEKNQSQLQDTYKSVYSHIPLKISLIGHAFAGKKTQAKAIQDTNQNLKIYNLEELIKKNIEALERLETPIEANPKYKTLKKNQIDQLIAEKAQEEEKFKEMKKLILPIRNSIKNNEPVDDEVIVTFLLENIKLDFPEKDPASVLDEAVKKNKRKKEIQEELLKIKEEQAKKPKAKVKEEQQLIAELAKITSDANKGFIILDFPQNQQQAKILESRLTGYIQEIDRPKSGLKIAKENLNHLVDKPIKPPGLINLKPSGLDLVIQINVPSKECIRRAVGRRQDPNTGIIYHMEDNPPPANDHKLNDRLQPIDDPSASEVNLISRHRNFDFMTKDLSLFYSPFGFAKQGLKLFQSINGHKTKDLVSKDIMEFINQLMSINEEKEMEIVGILKERGSITSETVINNVNMSGNMSYMDNNREPLDKIEDSHHTPIQKLDEEDFNRYLKKLEETRRKISQLVIENLYGQWMKLHDSYTNECKNNFKFFKKQIDQISSNFTKLQVKFTDFLKRPSRKLEEASKYAAKYNKFADEYPELKEDPQVKEEFHQDVVDLSDRIWEIIDIRKNEAIEERKKIMTSGWIEKEMERFYQHVEKLFVIEVEKFLNTLNIIRDYYSSLDSRTIFSNESQIINVLKPSEILNDIHTVPLENENDYEMFPKVDKLHKNCIKIVFKLEERVKSINFLLKINSVTKDSSEMINHKKIIRSMTFRRGNGNHTDSILIEDKRDIFLYEDEMKNAIKNEKNKFKYRVTLLKHWGSEKLKVMRGIANNIFETLDEWIINTVKAENEAMNSLIDFLNSDIERERKVRLDSELDGFDIYNLINVKEQLENVIEPLPLKEMQESARFNLEQFRMIYEELKSYETQKNFIDISIFVEIYIKRYLIEVEHEGVPQTLRDLSFHNFNKFIKYFEYSIKEKDLVSSSSSNE